MDFATTMNALSWEFYGRFYRVLIDYGIVYLPLLIFLYKNWLSEDILGKDANQTIVALTVKKMLLSVITFFFLYWIAFIPVIPLSTINDYRPTATHNNAFNLNAEKLVDTMGGVNVNIIKVPLVWAGLEIFIQTINKGFISALPETAGDVRGAIADVIKNNQIKDPALSGRYTVFYNQCYRKALGKFQLIKKNDVSNTNRRGRTNSRQSWWRQTIIEDTNWVGGKFYLETEGFYKPCPTGSACYLSAPSTPAGFYYPTGSSCAQEWSNTNGLKAALIEEFKIVAGTQSRRGGGRSVDYLLKLRLENKTGISRQTQDGGGWFEGNWFSLNTITTIVKDILVLVGAWITEFLLEIVTTAVVAFLPIGQAIALGFFVIVLPIAMIVSGLRPDIFIGFLVYYFAIGFLTVIWAIVAFIDNNIMNILAGQGGTGPGSGIAETAAQIVTHTTLTGSLISIGVAYLYYQSTTMWFKIMTMVGKDGMSEAGSAMKEAGGTGQDVGDTTKTEIGRHR